MGHDNTPLISLTSILALEVLKVVRELAPDIILISQMIIGVLTIAYLTKKLLTKAK